MVSGHQPRTTSSAPSTHIHLTLALSASHTTGSALLEPKDAASFSCMCSRCASTLDLSSLITPLCFAMQLQCRRQHKDDAQPMTYPPLYSKGGHPNLGMHKWSPTHHAISSLACHSTCCLVLCSPSLHWTRPMYSLISMDDSWIHMTFSPSCKSSLLSFEDNQENTSKEEAMTPTWNPPKSDLTTLSCIP